MVMMMMMMIMAANNPCGSDFMHSYDVSEKSLWGCLGLIVRHGGFGCQEILLGWCWKVGVCMTFEPIMQGVQVMQEV